MALGRVWSSKQELQKPQHVLILEEGQSGIRKDSRGGSIVVASIEVQDLLCTASTEVQVT